MRGSFAKIWGASAMLAWGTACGGSSVGGGSAGGGGAGASGAAGAAGASVGVGGNTGAAGAGLVSSGAGGLAGIAGGPPIAIGVQQKAEKLDVLFVVDNSVAMADKQGVLEASLPSFVNRLVNPLCVDAQGKPSAQQPSSAAAACASGSRELTPVTDLHLGVITTSIGGHGGLVCGDALAMTDDHLDDQAELLPAKRAGVTSYNGAGFLSYDATGTTGVSNIGSVITDLKTMVIAAGEHGCGFEAPLEAMYRFLVDPEPPLSVVKSATNITTPMGINAELLAQRKAFLRPDSAVAIVILSDENDCSIRDDGVGWFVGSNMPLPLATTACDANPNDPCCRSCAQNESTPPPGCAALTADANCGSTAGGTTIATHDNLHDSLNLRCFHQKQRFGFDLLYPVERYSNALSNPKISNRAGALIDNPLFAAQGGLGPRSATLISVSTIVGVPWQDLAADASPSAGSSVQNLDAEQLASHNRWSILLGDATQNEPPSDPFMIESIAPRTGQNPLTHDAIMAASSQSPTASPINGHEQNIPDLDDLQYACTFALPTPKVCANGDFECACSPDNNGDSSFVTTANSPLCQPPAGGAASTTQYYAKGDPGVRELRLAQLLGARAVPGSICPSVFDDSSSSDYGYASTFDALLARIATTLK